VDPGGKDKVSRARSVTVFVENGRVLLRSGALWLDALLGELTMFPESEHDDQVDALVYGVLELLLEGEKAVVTSSVVGREAVERMFG
jgi:predicted phage terminase large subunit-like protein